jgi:hypothetical protein
MYAHSFQGLSRISQQPALCWRICDAIEENFDLIFETLNGEISQDYDGGDFSIIVRPLPKIKLRYIFYLADEEFPASATCLFSNNALSFLPVDALADTGEYTSKKIIDLIL